MNIVNHYFQVTKHIRYNKIIETEFFIIYISMYNILIYN